ncbi:Aspartic proteinase 36 [Linum perenne]
MARRPSLASLLLPFLIGFFYSSTPLTALFESSDRHHRASTNATAVLLGPAMILPLFPSVPKTFDNPSYRRHLQRSLGASSSLPHARMGLYDDLLIHGYYTTHVWIGTPPQKFSLIVDTGSTVTYVPCSTCEQCGHHEDPKFDPESSSTYDPVICTLECTCDIERGVCVYERQYAEMSTSSGVLGWDLLSFGNESGLQPHRAVFGCENLETGEIYSQHADGIMGLGRGDLSVVDQLVGTGVINDSFALCYGGMDIGGGAMVLGSISPPSGMSFAYSDPVRRWFRDGHSPYYNIDLKEIHVAGKKLQLDTKVFDGKHGTVLDSGTTYAYLPETAYNAFKDAIVKELHSLKQIQGPDPNYNDICFSGATSDPLELSHFFPKVEFVFDKQQKYQLSPENYLFRHSRVKGAYCLGVFPNGKDPTTLLGGIVTRNTLVVYDRENVKVGFWKTNCSELWERLQRASSSPAPSPHPTSDKHNQTKEASPNLAPSPNDQSPYVLPDGIYIGKIEFEMLFNVNYSDLKNNLDELTESIAQDLRVNTSQVHVESLTPDGKASVVEWSIFPSGSANSISNGSALNIISRVVKHQMQLPASFGTYKLVHWKVQEPIEQAWWETHYIVVIVGSMIALVLVLSGIGLCLAKQRRPSPTMTYEPVTEDAVLEQELQPL